MKVVVDSNLLISSFIFGGKPERLFDLCSLGIIEGYLSDETMREVQAKLCDPNGKFRITPEPWTIVAMAIQDGFKIVPVTKLPEIPQLRDKLDLHILGAAEQIAADVIVSGDKDLLELGHYKSIPIVTVARILEQWD